MKQAICQSCGMPLQKEKDFGTESDGSKSEEYCFHCFQNGKFLDDGITLQAKIEKNVRFGKMMGMSEEKARDMASDILPGLKRWRK
jgi:Putative zinc ribbon domain